MGRHKIGHKVFNPSGGRDMKRTVQVIMAMLLLCGSASLVSAQQRPLLTEDVDIIPPGTIRIEGGVDFLQGAKFPATGLTGDLTRVGVDEIALFIITPVPGSAIYEQLQGYKSLSELNFSPTWREDYQRLSRFRLQLYARFLFWKLRYHPLKLLRQPVNFLRRRFETKMEMVPYRAIVLRWLGATVNG